MHSIFTNMSIKSLESYRQKYVEELDELNLYVSKCEKIIQDITDIIEDKRKEEASLNALLPCPFCGSEDISVVHKGNLFEVSCKNCGISTKMYRGYYKSLE